MYEVFLAKSIQKKFNKLDDIYYSRIKDKILEMEQNPRNIGSKKLSNLEEYRIRVGKYRILYEIDDENKIVSIYDIDHRKDVYKKK